MDELYPPQPLVLRGRYDYLQVRRDRRLRNSPYPMANDELGHVFDCHFAGDGPWVAILTGECASSPGP